VAALGLLPVSVLEVAVEAGQVVAGRSDTCRFEFRAGERPPGSDRYSEVPASCQLPLCEAALR
jgi:hypothetical protein